MIIITFPWFWMFMAWFDPQIHDSRPGDGAQEDRARAMRRRGRGSSRLKAMDSSASASVFLNRQQQRWKLTLGMFGAKVGDHCPISIYMYLLIYIHIHTHICINIYIYNIYIDMYVYIYTHFIYVYNICCRGLSYAYTWYHICIGDHHTHTK